MSEDLRFGAKLAHYAVIERLGAGGMGVVYRAHDGKLDRDVALKVLPKDFAADPDRRRRFEREAKAASALSHPGVAHIYELGEAEGVHFIVMEYVEGATLQDLMRQGPLPGERILDLAVQVADALGEAHAHGIIHRDVKPGNIMVTPRGRAKVLDFGLARMDPARSDEGGRLETMSGTDAGVILGTVPYMSPEQVLGRTADARSDVFSLGAVLFEMATGKRPFRGDSAAETADQILHSHPSLASTRTARLPRGLPAIIERSLHKEPAARYATANEMAADLRRLGADRRPHDTRSLRWAVVLVLMGVLVGTAGLVLARRAARREAAAQAVPRVQDLARAGSYAEAFDLAERIRPDLPDAAPLDRLLPEIADELSVASEPAGALVSLARFPGGSSAPPAYRSLGTTPLADRRIARGDYLLRLEKEGFAPVERTISTTLARVERDPPVVRLQVRLVEAARVPEGMALIPDGEYALTGWGRLTDFRARLDEFLIDRAEVSNRDYKEFVDAGAYLRKELWAHPFERDGGLLSFEEGMRQLRDRLGLPGPRSWSNQAYPEGKADHPVTDVSWYEAVAYCAFRDKSLPTLYQWEKAARAGAHTTTGAVVMPWGHIALGESAHGRANFQGTGTAPVRSLEFGMSPHGLYHTAGNVAEWCSNPTPPGFVTAGGSWSDPPYRFGQYGGFPGFFTAPTLGFRCARNVPGTTGDQGGFPIEAEKEVPTYPLSSGGPGPLGEPLPPRSLPSRGEGPGGRGVPGLAAREDRLPRSAGRPGSRLPLSSVARPTPAPGGPLRPLLWRLRGHPRPGRGGAVLEAGPPGRARGVRGRARGLRGARLAG